MKIRNTHPIGDVDIPLLGSTVKAGEVVEVSTEQAALLLVQADNYKPADEAAKKLLVKLTADAAKAEAEADTTDGE